MNEQTNIQQALEREHEQLVMALKKPGQDILDSLTPEKCDLWHMASCIPSEAGELFDAVKKHVLYQKPIDLENIEEELGDLEFYMRGVRQALGISREQTLCKNIAKLRVRYHKGKFTEQQAQERADKK